MFNRGLTTKHPPHGVFGVESGVVFDKPRGKAPPHEKEQLKQSPRPSRLNLGPPNKKGGPPNPVAKQQF